ncbi:hypothetical protein [Paenibacillus sp. XY044]|uniref:hypothetical protein n=1 Tax=Paenibacillus sp. XY044 TaxID=2026089 RepID=UPI0015C5A50E|nr:hypothetical protein [Paenibacillus sp. XY044]
MIEASQCQLGDMYEEIATGQLFIVKNYDEIRVFEVYGQPGNYTTALNEKYHRKVKTHS